MMLSRSAATTPCFAALRCGSRSQRASFQRHPRPLITYVRPRAPLPVGRAPGPCSHFACATCLQVPTRLPPALCGLLAAGMAGAPAVALRDLCLRCRPARLDATRGRRLPAQPCGPLARGGADHRGRPAGGACSWLRQRIIDRLSAQLQQLRYLSQPHVCLWTASPRQLCLRPSKGAGSGKAAEGLPPPAPPGSAYICQSWSDVIDTSGELTIHPPESLHTAGSQSFRTLSLWNL